MSVNQNIFDLKVEDSEENLQLFDSIAYLIEGKDIKVIHGILLKMVSQAIIHGSPPGQMQIALNDTIEILKGYIEEAKD